MNASPYVALAGQQLVELMHLREQVAALEVAMSLSYQREQSLRNELIGHINRLDEQFKSALA